MKNTEDSKSKRKGKRNMKGCAKILNRNYPCKNNINGLKQNKDSGLGIWYKMSIVHDGLAAKTSIGLQWLTVASAGPLASLRNRILRTQSGFQHQDVMGVGSATPND